MHYPDLNSLLISSRAPLRTNLWPISLAAVIAVIAFLADGKAQAAF